MPRLTFPRLVPVLLVLSVGVAACGGSDAPEQVDATVSQPRTTARQQTPTVTMPTTTTPPTVTTSPPTTPQTTPAQPAATTPTTPPANGGATQPSEQARTTPSEQSGGAGTPASCGTVAGGFINGVQASGAGCGEATGVASAWLDAIGESGPDADVAAAGYACSGALNGTKASVTCIADGGRRVTFEASP
jgi:hypothetical protein